MWYNQVQALKTQASLPGFLTLHPEQAGARAVRAGQDGKRLLTWVTRSRDGTQRQALLQTH